jgi:hypothetical protein
MRRNLALVFVADDPVGRDWIDEAAAVRERVLHEMGEVVAILPPGAESRGLPAIVDADGSVSAKLGLTADGLPALFVLDRYGTLFASNGGPTAEPELRPADIPRWHGFIACRCS